MRIERKEGSQKLHKEFVLDVKDSMVPLKILSRRVIFQIGALGSPLRVGNGLEKRRLEAQRTAGSC
jgi:hypothetical protein